MPHLAVLKSQPTVLISLGNFEACRMDLLLNLAVLSSVTSQENIYEGAYGLLSFILDPGCWRFGDPLDVETLKFNQHCQRRRALNSWRTNGTIAKLVPKSRGIKGVVEVRDCAIAPKLKPPRVPELTQSYMARRFTQAVGNQHIHAPPQQKNMMRHWYKY